MLLFRILCFLRRGEVGTSSSSGHFQLIALSQTNVTSYLNNKSFFFFFLKRDEVMGCQEEWDLPKMLQPQAEQRLESLSFPAASEGLLPQWIRPLATF